MQFWADFMLGKLARELRLLGIDCAYTREPDSERLWQNAKRMGRLFLTRNTKLKDKEGVVFIASEKMIEQVRQILNAFPDLPIEPLQRCLDCNSLLIEREKVSVKLLVPFYVYQTQDRFYFCPNCQKIYWRGTHYEDMKNRISRYLKKEGNG
ncbi:MAG: Mut7-C RNAse domain-containing protein [candidate division WOR-3 bacterium]